MTTTSRDRYRGCLFGLAVGDAVGTTLEFQPPGAFKPLTDMVGGGPFCLQTGQWTDDTTMALCLAESLVHCRGFDARDQMDRYVRWWRQGYMSCTGTCFDIGGTTAAALARYEATGEALAGVSTGAGNGSIMRLAPVPMYFAAQPALVVEMAALSSATTHGAVEARDACRYLAFLIVKALGGMPKVELLSAAFSQGNSPLCAKIATVAAGSFLGKEPPAIQGLGYVVASLEAALWAFSRGRSYRDVVLKAANLGDDADTTAAVAGQLAGAYYGVGGKNGIPIGWAKKLAWREKIEALANSLWGSAQANS